MAIPTKEELFARVAAAPSVMNPVRYPFDYAVDFLNQHKSILPAEFKQNVVSKMKNPFCTVVIQRWAEEENENIYVFAGALADAYLELNSIVRLENIPVMTTRTEWMTWLNEVCPD
jgi:hypothetical protein